LGRNEVVKRGRNLHRRGPFRPGIEGARILSGRIGFGKGSGELFLIRFAGTDEAVFRCLPRGGV